MRALQFNELNQVAGAFVTIKPNANNNNVGYTIYVPSTGLTDAQYSTIDTYFNQAINGEITWDKFEKNVMWYGVPRTAIDTYMQNYQLFAVFLG